MELRKIWNIIWRRKWIIIQAFIIISLTAILGSHFITPVYESSAKALISSSDSSSSLLSSIGLSDLSSFSSMVDSDSDIETQIELSTLNPILEKVISKLQLRTKGGDLLKPDKLRTSIPIISAIFPLPNIEISQVEDTDLIEIKATSSDTHEAAMIANTLAQLFIDDNQKQRRLEYGSAKNFIEDQIKLARADYINVLDEIKRFNIANKTVNLEAETKLAIEKMAELMKEKEDNIIDLAETRAKIETLKEQLGGEGETDISSSAISENPQIENLKKTLTDLELQLAGALAEKRQDHPDVISLNKRIRIAREELRKEAVIFTKSSRELGTLERNLAALEAHLIGVNEDIKQYLSLLYTIPEKAFIQSQMNLKLTASQKLYGSLLEYHYQVGVAEAMTLSDIRLVEPATEADIDNPKSPEKVLIGIMGVFLGLMFGFGLAFLVDYIDDTINSPEEAKEHGLSLLGTIPKFKKKDIPIISHRDPKDPICESYRSIRNSLKFASLDKPLKHLLIISSLENEGKSTTAGNLAVSFATEGKKVLLVDTDLRKPSLPRLFGLSNSLGITSILAKDANAADVIKETGIAGLSLLASGPVPPDPGLMIESTKMKELIKNFAEQYDIIILDSPPILLSNDAVMMAGYVDSSIMIMESGKTSMRAFSQARELLKQANIEPIWTILNKVRIERSRHYYYYYKSEYQKGRNK